MRTTTPTLKNTSAATIAARRAVEAETAERAAGRDELAEGHADHDRRQHERHHHERAQQTSRPGKRNRCSTKATGRPSTTESSVAAAADQSVNHSTRWTRGRPSTSSTAAGEKVPSGHSPRASIPATG